MDFTAELLFDGVEVGSNAGSGGPDFSVATVIFGDVAGGGGHAASRAYYDEVDVIRVGVGLLSNTSFELAELPPGGGAETRGNWRPNGNASRSNVHASAGSWSALADIPAGSTAGYHFQDFDLAPGELFTFDFMVRPEIAAAQVAEVVFDWDRGASGLFAGIARITLGPASTPWDAFGIGGVAPALPLNVWTQVELRLFIGVSEGWKIGAV